MGAQVTISDPFELQRTGAILQELLETDGVRVLILRRVCALSPEKKGHKRYNPVVDQAHCLSESCGCNRLCTRVIKCPGLTWNQDKKVTRIDPVICTGCGVCAAICPQDAILLKKEVSA
jgi:indolepyruvate ferredoxin oxidoreductase alpha subunit